MSHQPSGRATACDRTDSNRRLPAERRVLYPLRYCHDPVADHFAGARLRLGDQPVAPSSRLSYLNGRRKLSSQSYHRLAEQSLHCADGHAEEPAYVVDEAAHQAATFRLMYASRMFSSRSAACASARLAGAGRKIEPSRVRTVKISTISNADDVRDNRHFLNSPGTTD